MSFSVDVVLYVVCAWFLCCGADRVGVLYIIVNK